MPRWLVAIALWCSAMTTWVVMLPDVAHARSLLSSEFGPAMCGEGSQTVLVEGFAFARALSLLSAASISTTATPTASAEERMGVTADDDEGPPAWCISPDDPRCAPRDQSAPVQSQRANTPMQNASAVQLPELAFGRSVDPLRPVQLGAPRAGVGVRLERPPEQQ